MKCILDYGSLLEKSQCKRCIDIPMAHDGQMQWLLVHVRVKADLEIFIIIVGRNEASAMT